MEAVSSGDIRRLIINVPPRTSKPVAHDALVLCLDKGFVPLARIEVGDVVQTHRGRFRRVTAVHDQGVLPVLRLRTTTGRTVEAAGDHPFLTPDGWAELRTLRPDDVVGRFDFNRPLWGDVVASVEPAGAKRCLCLTVEGDESFTANGFAVHNSSLVSVAWPAWVWAQQADPELALSGAKVQFLFASYAQSLSMRDSVKTRRLISSPWYQDRWGDRFSLTGDQNAKIRFDNTEGGYRLATSVDGALTGEGGSIIVVDDAHNAIEVESDLVRQRALDWWDTAMSTRLNDPKTGAFVIIMQRLYEDDLTGHILSKSEGEWTHLCLPMRYEPGRHCVTSIGWEDPRKGDGELLCPERFGEPEVASLESALGPWRAAGQLQQRPAPKGGGIFQRDWWQSWENDEFPAFEYVVASLDTAYTEKEENDPSALTVWGYYRDNGRPRVVLMNAWRKWLQLGSPELTREPGETDQSFLTRARKTWGLVDWVIYSCRRFKVDQLLIEAKATGITAAQEIRRRIFATESWGIQLVDPKGDKVARAHAVQPVFSNGLIWAPDREWAELVIDEMAVFPKGRHDDLTDTATQAVKHLRDIGLLTFAPEEQAEIARSLQYRSPRKSAPLYPV